MGKRTVAVLVVVCFVIGLTALVVGVGSPSHGTRAGAPAGGLPRLPAGGGTEAQAAKGSLSAPTAAAADSSVSGVTFTVSGQLPELGGTAPAYRLVGGATKDDATRLADALGVDGAVSQQGSVLVVRSPSASVTVEPDAGDRWSMYRQPVGADCSTSSDGVTSCSASGVAAPRTFGCPVPPCAPDQPCPDAKPCPIVPVAPSRPADLPSKTEAERAARAVLAKAGISLDGATVQVDDRFSAWGVSVTPTVDGRVVDGMVTTVVIGPGGKVESANGYLGKLERLGNYPLAGTAVGLDRLRAGRWLSVGSIGTGGIRATPEPAVGSVEPDAAASPAASDTPGRTPSSGSGSGGGGSATAGSAGGSSGSSSGSAGSTGSAPALPNAPVDPSCGKACAVPPPDPMPTPIAPPKLTVTGVRLELALVGGADGSGLVVPAYVFETGASGKLPPVAAVSDDLLVAPAPGAKPLVDQPVATKPA